MVDPGQRKALDAATHAMISQDARWVADALLSCGNSIGDSSGILPFTLIGYSSRIAYEGSIAIRSVTPEVGIPSLAASLPDGHAEVIARARHATKFLDDTKKTFADLLNEMAEYYRRHQAEFLGNAVWFARSFESDLGLYVGSGHILSSTIPLQFRFGTPASIPIGELGDLMFSVAKAQGQILAVLAQATGDTTEPTATINYLALGRLAGKDRRARKYLARRFDPAFSDTAKLILLMVEGEANTARMVLPLTEVNHAEPAFRARTVSLFHLLRAIKEILAKHPSAVGAGAQRMRALMEEPPTRQLLTDAGARAARNRCMHYEIRDPRLTLNSSLPMFGIIEAVYPGSGFYALDQQTRAVLDRVTDALSDWAY